MNPPERYHFQSHSGSSASEAPPLVDAVSSIFSNSFGTNPKTRQPYRLGPNTTKKRLALAHRLFLASDEADHSVGYLFATEISSSRGSVGWVCWLDRFVGGPAATSTERGRHAIGCKFCRALCERSLDWVCDPKSDSRFRYFQSRERRVVYW